MYDQFSEDYDRFVNWKARLEFEMPFLTQQLDSLEAQAPLRVLDAACGTGMHAIELTRRGYHAVGADLFPEMIDRAQANAAAAGVNTLFFPAGFGDLARTFLQEHLLPFDAVICLGNSLPHILSTRGLIDALADFAACLRPGGLLLMQNRNFDAVLAARERWMAPQSYREGNREWVFLRSYDYELDGQIAFNILTLQRDGTNAWQQRVTSTHLRPLAQADLGGALATAGFERVRYYGGMDGSPFDIEKSGDLVVTARRSGG